jgi:hypothetical protein
MSQTVAIEVYLKFEHALFEKLLFPFPLIRAKLISNYFDSKRGGTIKIFLLIKRQFICASYILSVKSDASRARKKSASS